MSMQGNGSGRKAGEAESARGALSFLLRTSFKPFFKPLPSLALCLMAGGCASIGQALGPSAPVRGVSIAFESIDGLPRDLSQKLVRDLDEEAAALRIAVVPSGGEAAYRMRGYLAAHAQGAGTSIAWAWDVYDSDLHRAFRLSGEEPAGPPAGRIADSRAPDGRSWAAADDAVLRRIARTGMQQLVDFMAAAPAPAAPTAPATPAPTRSGSDAVASRDDPDPSGLPQQRPVQAGLSGTTRLADATAGR
jgi:hypothetical protein